MSAVAALLLTRRGFVALLAGAAIAAAAPRVLAQAFKKSTLTIVTDKGRYDFDVEMALTPRQHAQGLMFRRTLAPDAGMLFDYRRPEPVSMWMKNTYIPLDMLFIASDGRIVNIAERTVPRSTEIIPSDGPVRAVLEVNGGTAARLGIEPGDKVIHPIFEND